MLYFTRVLHDEEQGYLHFSFSCILSLQKKKYQVSVQPRGPRRYHFVMEEKYGRWRITSAPLPPQWIFRMEALLEQVIHDSEKQKHELKNHLRLVKLPDHLKRPDSFVTE